ncbi:MAG: SufD family Fe-S cluster assembly protein [Ruminococcaceae bacterium]|nr:SufD family Fe-S cluster assembly protein [Oscillospiraceae bacterium]
MDKNYIDVLEKIADIRDFPAGAYNIRSDGKSIGKNDSEKIKIEFKKDVSGLDIYVSPDTVKESVHIPVVIGESGHTETVYNDFHIGDNSEIVIIAGCGIHNCGEHESKHDGIHSFHVGKNCKVKYIEKHYGSGDGKGERVMNPVTKIYLDEGSKLEIETVQIEGIDSTKRETYAKLSDNSTVVIKEKLMTHGNQFASTDFEVDLDGSDCSASLVSRSVAKNNSKQVFFAKMTGNNSCHGHSECDAIIMDNASVKAVPEITANHVDASLIHEAAIGKIAGEQLIKLMTLGMSEAEAEQKIIEGFLK